MRGSTPVPGPETARYGGNTPCVEVRANDSILVLDAGTGIQSFGRAMGKLGRKLDDQPIKMDLFLTHGGRAIPKTVLLDEELQVLGTWGPRPQEAMALVKRIKSDPAIAHTYSQEVHKWYAQDRQQNIQAELAVLLGHAQGA